MEFWKIIGLVVLIVLVARSYAPDQYVDGKDYMQSLWDGYDTDYEGLLDQNKVQPDGTVVTPESGKSYGRPYDYFECAMDSHCSERFSITAICDINAGTCFEP